MGNNDLIYLSIPKKFESVYYKLLHAIADFGQQILKECDSSNCDNNLISCWNLFQSAIACEELNRTKESELFINFIEKQLAIIYKNNIIDTKDTIYAVFIGAHPSGELNFDIKDKNYFIQYNKKNNITGDYKIYINAYGNYGWICVPKEFDTIKVTSGNFFDVPLKGPITQVVNINDENIEYNCYRISEALTNGEHIFNIIN